MLISESFLDRILHPELRDRMILFRGATSVYVIYILLNFS